MSAEHVEARPGAYADSVTLMRVSADVRQADGVQAALVAMATELNLDLLPAMGFQPPPGASPNHLLIAVRASDDAALSGALGVVESALSARPGAGTGPIRAQPPRTTRAAIRANGPGLALISVPGRYAFAEAMDALEAGCDVMIFSDNVPVEQEIMLKDIAAQRDLIVMGPDCGTAIVGGIGLGFSHTLATGPVGLVAASGTGAQQVLCLLDYAGVGVSAALGVGGRDLSAAVGGRSARAALTALDADPGTELIVVVSKPPAPEVAAGLRDVRGRPCDSGSVRADRAWPARPHRGYRDDFAHPGSDDPGLASLARFRARPRAGASDRHEQCDRRGNRSGTSGRT